MHRVGLARGGAIRTFSIAAACLICALLFSHTAVYATIYSYDDGTANSSISWPGAAFANVFTLNSETGKIVTFVNIKQVTYSDYSGGTADVCIWAYNAADGLPGSVLGTIEGVTIPDGTNWTVVDFTSLNIPAPADGKLFAGLITNTAEVPFDAAGGANSYRRIPSGTWARYGSGDLMVRMVTGDPSGPSPTPPGNVSITPQQPCYGDTLIATASGSTVAGGETIVYKYQWASSMDGQTWSAWGHPGRPLAPRYTQINQYWKARARATITGYQSDWVESAMVRVQTLIVRTIPNNGTTNQLRRSRPIICLRWPMRMKTVEDRVSFKAEGGTPVPGVLEWLTAFSIMRFRPAAPLAPNTRYIITIAAGAVRKTGERSKRAETSSFTTGDQPIAIAWIPKGSGVSTAPVVRVTFDRAINPSTVKPARFLVTRMSDGVAIPGTLSTSGADVRFTPASPFAAGTQYEVILSRFIADLAGNELGAGFRWRFTMKPPAAAAAAGILTVTAAAAPAQGEVSPMVVNLSSAADVTVNIASIAGRPIAVLPPQHLTAGMSTLLWNGRSTQGTRVPAGQYLAQITARGQDGRQATSQVMLRR